MERDDLARQAHALMTQGKIDEAGAVLDHAIGLTPTDLPDPGRRAHVDLLLMKADLLQGQGNRADAERYVDRARRIDPARMELVVFDAMARLDAGEAKEALAVIDTALARSPVNAQLLLERGLLLLHINDPAQAEGVFADLVRISEFAAEGETRPKEEGVAYLGLAISQAAIRPGEGIDPYLRGLNIVGTDALAILSQLGAGGYDQTIVELTQQATRKAPDDLALARVRTGIQISAGDADGAIAEAERRLDQETATEARVSWMLIAAQAEDSRQRPQAAIDWLRRVLDEDVGNVAVLEILALHVVRTGAAQSDLADVHRRIEQATLTIEEPARLARLEDLARRLAAATRPN